MHKKGHDSFGGRHDSTACRYRQADKTCQVALADSTAPQAVQAGLGSAASSDFLPSQYTHLVTVRSHCMSTAAARLCLVVAVMPAGGT